MFTSIIFLTCHDSFFLTMLFLPKNLLLLTNIDIMKIFIAYWHKKYVFFPVFKYTHGLGVTWSRGVLAYSNSQHEMEMNGQFHLRNFLFPA
jgi:hypothetical protein